MPPLGEALKDGAAISYTQWEAWLALYHGKLLLIAKATDAAERGPDYAQPGDKGAAQIKHLARLEAVQRYPGCTLASSAHIAKHIAYTANTRSAGEGYAERGGAQARHRRGLYSTKWRQGSSATVILIWTGKKQAVRNALEIYEKEIAGGPTQTNFGDIAMRRWPRRSAKWTRASPPSPPHAAQGGGGFAARAKEERRAAYVAGVTELYNRARDIALASYDGEAAAEAVLGSGRGGAWRE